MLINQLSPSCHAKSEVFPKLSHNWVSKLRDFESLAVLFGTAQQKSWFSHLSLTYPTNVTEIVITPEPWSKLHDVRGKLRECVSLRSSFQCSMEAHHWFRLYAGVVPKSRESPREPLSLFWRQGKSESHRRPREMERKFVAKVPHFLCFGRFCNFSLPPSSFPRAIAKKISLGIF